MKNYKLIEKGNVVSPKGFAASGIAAGLKKYKKDLALILSETEATTAMVCTSGTVKAAPIKWNINHFNAGDTKTAILINSGNANACTGPEGIDKIDIIAEEINKKYNIPQNKLLFASTGVIGVPLPEDKILAGLIPLFKTADSNPDRGEAAAQAILTTDTKEKTIAAEVTVGNKKVTIGAMAKGSGMIRPNMATMLCFVTTDLNIDGQCLQQLLKDAVGDTFNMISVDGDMSTNDTVIVLANGMAGNDRITSESISNKENAAFIEAFQEVLTILAKAIAKDGEGATKLLEAQVLGVDTKENARTIAKQIVDSALVKTAIFGADANWGRIVMAAGSTEIPFNEQALQMHFISKAGHLDVLMEGRPIPFDEDKAKAILSEDEITVVLNLNMGSAEAKAWGCDLTYDYVKINGSYRS